MPGLVFGHVEEVSVAVSPRPRKRLTAYVKLAELRRVPMKLDINGSGHGSRWSGRLRLLDEGSNPLERERQLRDRDVA
jgi:hypothetical protein